LVLANSQWPVVRLHLDSIATAVNAAKPGGYAEAKESSDLKVGSPVMPKNEMPSLDASVSALLPPTLRTRWVPSFGRCCIWSGMLRVVEPSTARRNASHPDGNMLRTCDTTSGPPLVY
jgi:hypothetical protein